MRFTISGFQNKKLYLNPPNNTSPLKYWKGCILLIAVIITTYFHIVLEGFLFFILNLPYKISESVFERCLNYFRYYYCQFY